jgi:ABC-type multidrug transport system fused ATPase/permease subunit
MLGRYVICTTRLDSLIGNSIPQCTCLIDVVIWQEPVLFACSIRDNIKYGNPSATMKQIEEAAKLANAHDFIMGFTDGYDTQVGEKGSQLSGGQKQRIAIGKSVFLHNKNH